MSTCRCLCLLSAGLLVLMPALVLGNGFALNENDAKAVAMGGAFAAQADNASAVYFNPAGIVQLEGTHVSAGLTPIIFNGSFESSGTSFVGQAGQTTDLEEGRFLIPHFYLTHQLNDHLSVGIGEFSRFGLGTEWPDDWEGRYVTGGTLAEINSFSINPVVAWRVAPRLSVAAGPVLQYLDMKLKNKVLNPLAPGDAQQDLRSKLTADDWAWGWNVGMLVWLTEDIKLGASYRSHIKHNLPHGRIRLESVPEELGGNVITRASTDLELPATAYFAVAWSHGRLTLEFDAQWTEWSAFDTLQIDFAQPLLGSIDGISETRDWKDTWAYRFGIEYRLNDIIDLRAGFFYDESPIPDKSLDPLVPSGDRCNYTVGLGLHHGRASLDLAYNYLDDEDRDFDNLLGDYETKFPLLEDPGRVTGEFKDVNAHVFSFSLSYHF